MSGWRERNAKKETPRIEVNEINFPSLTTSTWEEKKEPVKKATKSFASLAKEWNEHAEQEKVCSEMQEERRRIEEYEREQIRKRRETLYNCEFGNSHARTEDTYYENQDDEYIVSPPEDWKTISKKVRKPRSHVFQPPPQIEEDTTWGDDDDYE